MGIDRDLMHAIAVLWYPMQDDVTRLDALQYHCRLQVESLLFGSWLSIEQLEQTPGKNN
jgi:hypothetical protein